MPKPSRHQIVGDFGWSDYALRRVAASAAVPSAPTGHRGGGLLRVILPEAARGQRQDRSVLVKTTAETTLAELMAEVCRKPNVQLDPQKHAFTMTSGGPELEGGNTVQGLRLEPGEQGQPELKIQPRSYADAPKRLNRAPSRSQADAAPHMCKVRERETERERELRETARGSSP